MSEKLSIKAKIIYALADYSLAAQESTTKRF